MSAEFEINSVTLTGRVAAVQRRGEKTVFTLRNSTGEYPVETPNPAALGVGDWALVSGIACSRTEDGSNQVFFLANQVQIIRPGEAAGKNSAGS